MIKIAISQAAQALRLQALKPQSAASRIVSPNEPGGLCRSWIGCSHWTTPYRPTRGFASGHHDEDVQDTTTVNRSKDTGPSSRVTDANTEFDDDAGGASAETEGSTVDRVGVSSKLNRPQLPSSIKKLNRLLSHHRSMTIPDSDLLERFVKGRGPGGQAINKTNSSVSLTHLPTGIRIQAQPTRSREENRKIARKILAERLDLLRAHEAARLATPEWEGADDGQKEGEQLSRKEKEKGLAKVWSREEIRWEKERRRKLNKAKKSKKKRKEDTKDSDDRDEDAVNTDGTE